jgi:hypothetical protein
MSDFIFGFLSLLLGAILGFHLGKATLSDDLTACAKQHNVYACEYVAVPKKDGE